MDIFSLINTQLKQENKKLIQENKELAKSICEKDFEIKHLKELLDDYLKAKENGCERGDYCGHCEHSVFVKCSGAVKCVCTYGRCKHFKKETEIIDWHNLI